MSILMKFLIIPIVILINFNTVHYATGYYAFQNYGVTEENDQEFSTFYKPIMTEKFNKLFGQQQLNKEELEIFSETYVISQYLNFLPYYRQTYLAPKNFVHFLILHKKYTTVNYNDKYKKFLSIYKEAMKIYYKNMTNMQLSPSVEKEYYKVQILFYYALFNSYGNALNQPTISVDEFLDHMITKGEINIQKKNMGWHESAQAVVYEEMVKQIATYKGPPQSMETEDSPSSSSKVPKPSDGDQMDIVDTSLYNQ